ncbi:MAG: NADH-quinone oxidoreductase subunit A [Actinomycetota bacterium]|nr:NADH-quinone oxidoreductase subunit A [Actinomycetota bacterium]
MLSVLASALAAFGSVLVLSLLLGRPPAGGRGGSWPFRAPYLGGGVPETHAWSRFHARYYPMSLVFVAFEMEMMFMYPWAVVYVREGVTALADMGVFLGLLSLGVLYAWREGALRWQ